MVTRINIELRGSIPAYRAFVADMDSSDPSLYYGRVIAEIEDQLEENADREFDFVDLDEIYSDSGQ